MTLKISEVFSKTPGGRYITDGPFSGELFRNAFLIPKLKECINRGQILIINFDGGYGYSVGFLEESFGGLIRENISKEEIEKHLHFISDEEPEIIEEIKKFIEEENIRKLKK